MSIISTNATSPKCKTEVLVTYLRSESLAAHFSALIETVEAIVVTIATIIEEFFTFASYWIEIIPPLTCSIVVTMPWIWIEQTEI